MQLDPDLNLQKAVNAVRHRETVKKQQATLRGMTTRMEGTIDAVHKTKQPHIRQNAPSRRESRDHGQGTPQHKRKSSATPSTNKKICRQCGKAPNHPRQQCPAREATCHNCLGCMRGAYQIQHKDHAVPFALTVPCRVPIALMSKVQSELQRMEKKGVISQVREPTDWCAGMVVVPKAGGKVRICVDLTKLNQSVRRERLILPSVEQTLAQLGGATVFSKLDANSGFWQVELTKESSLLTTFITPFGRYRFNRLPFGITSAPEHFQRHMSEVLQDLEEVVCLIDDILIYGKT